ncbi:MAG: cysteine--tRNA ligase [Candidatus Aminicenantes bacterium]|nr:cysteine--tRNA ligase [Candidatus Aminicenantes bacterium]
MIRLHNTLSGRAEEFVPIEPGRVKLYTCGPTVYDYPHIGNWRSYVFEDLLKRVLLYRGFRVLHVMNITDVDDKTIKGANLKGLSLQEYTKPFIESFQAERETLSILAADHYPRATDPENIRGMVEIIKVLLGKGIAYRKDGSIYFAIDRFPAYGRLSKIALEDRRPGSRGGADEYEKESVHDFALWKAPKEGEPSWDTEIGPGRPGWHIECSAMSARYFGPAFDIHCGGVDNIFPHHENEIAQSEAANGVKFVNYWVHGHHLVVDGEKMAKSKGNFYRLSDVLAMGYDAAEIRFLLLSTHYRKMLDFTEGALRQARASLERIRNFLVDLAGITSDGPPHPEVARLIDSSRTGFIEALEDDLNISEALASIFTLIKKANVLKDKGRLVRKDAEDLRAFILLVDQSILSVNLASVTVHAAASDGGSGGGAEADIEKKIDARQKARADKDFKRADEIRQELLQAGIVLEDTKEGIRWKRVGPPKS